ncbi:MAG: hypothetical protein AAGF46_09235 [Pseudomonadota bacterium]
MKLPSTLAPDEAVIIVPELAAPLQTWLSTQTECVLVQRAEPPRQWCRLPEGRPSAAVLRWLGEEVPMPAADWCVGLDPVFLQANQRDVFLANWPLADLTETEGAALADSVRAHLVGDSDPRIATAMLVAASSSRWYLAGRGAAPAADQTAPAELARQVPLRNFPPAGSEAKLVRRLATELQMLLHTHPANTARAASGRQPVNGVWWWGIGVLESTPAPSVAVPPLATDAPGWCGLWRWLNGTLVGRDRLATGGVVSAPDQPLQVLEKLLPAVALGDLTTVWIIAKDGVLLVRRPSGWRRLWQRVFGR